MTEIGPVDADAPCDGCPGMCCSFRIGRVSYLKADEDRSFEDLFRENEHWDEVLLEGGDIADFEWFRGEFEDGRVEAYFECGHLTDDGLCGVYDRRPEMCRRFECGAFEADDDEEAREWLEETMARPPGELNGAELSRETETVNSILREKAENEKQ